MATIEGDDTYFTNIDSDITQTQWESIIDQAIDKINGYGYPYNVQVSNMTGAAGSKVWNGTSAEKGFIVSVAVALYSKEYKSAGASSSSYGIGGINSSQSASAGGAGEIETLAKDAAERLKDLDVTVGSDITV